MGNPLKKMISFAEYEAFEQAEGNRWELHAGHLVAMAGTTKRHNRLVQSVARLVADGLGNTSCASFVSDVKLELVPHSDYVYPDLMATCEAADLANEEETFIRHPFLIVEVLSPSTFSYDRAEKRDLYFALPSLRYYIMIWQNSVRVDMFSKTPHGWLFEVFSQEQQVIRLENPDVQIPLQELYR